MALRLENVRFRYRTGQNVIDGLTLEVRTGEIATLLGRSGSGKTTVLNIIAGFLEPMSGKVLVDGRDVSGVPSRDRGLGMVMQDLSLFPNMTVLENVGYGLRARGMGRKEAYGRSMAVLSRMNMGALGDRDVNEISGGERQRVALARSLVYGPRLLLMDEPLSALDPSMREDLRVEVRRILKESRTTTLYVTHDRTEALSISDSVHMIDGGRIVESGAPREVHDRPRTSMGAAFMGITTPIPILGSKGRCSITPFGDVRIETGGDGALGYRPEKVRWEDPGDSLAISGVVAVCDYRGRDNLVEVASVHGRFIASSPRAYDVGARVRFYISGSDLFPLRS